MAAPSLERARAMPLHASAQTARSAQATSAPTRSYELQKFSSGRWLLDSVSDDKDVSIAMAKSLIASGRAPGGVRVMSVQSNRNGQFSEITIFRHNPGEEPARQTPMSSPKPAVAATSAAATREFKRSDEPRTPAAKKGRFADVLLALKLALGLGIALAAFQALRLMLH